MICNFRELTRGGSYAGIIGDVDLKECCLSAALRDRFDYRTPSTGISGTDKDVKRPDRESTCNFLADASVGSGDQRCLHVRPFRAGDLVTIFLILAR